MPGSGAEAGEPAASLLRGLLGFLLLAKALLLLALAFGSRRGLQTPIPDIDEALANLENWRSAPSEAETAAKMAAMRRRNRERTDRWIGRVMGGVVLAAVFVVAVVLGFLGNL
ncbi:hypothetical protein OG258_49365 [Streptomyces mirabilis]|uniref:hypothetical protein n=1 Tax=Streptomyces mirabilis TaxID=68239 RepID=UPI002E293208|nr:hypothetical protein [Streptomyces mirabilis]